MTFDYNFEQWLFIFYMYSFLGWCFESLVVSVRQRPIRWVNRGFMHGFFLPLYGSGCVMMLVVSLPFQNNLIMIFIAGFFGATLLEYVTGVIMEALFKIRYWDYSQRKLNYRGIICIRSSLAWGVLTIFMTKVLHPFIGMFILMIPSEVLKYAVIVITFFVAADFSLSFRTALDLRDILVKMEKIRGEMDSLQQRMDKLQENWNTKFGVVQGTLNNRFSAMQESMERRLDFMTEKIEEKLSGFREIKILQAREQIEDNRTGKEQEQRQSEMISIRDRLLVVKAKISDLKDIHGNWKVGMIVGNPTMNSVKFKKTFEELRSTVFQKKQEKKNHTTEE